MKRKLGYTFIISVAISSLYSILYMSKYGTVYDAGQHSIENIWRVTLLLGFCTIILLFGYNLFQKKVKAICAIAVISISVYFIGNIYYSGMCSVWIHHPKLESINENFFCVEKENVVYKVYCKESECEMLEYINQNQGSISTMEIRLIGNDTGILERIVIY